MIIPDDIAESGIAFNNQYFDLKGLCAYSKLGISTLRNHIERNGLPCFKVKGKMLIRQSEFDKWIERFRENRQQDIEAMANDAIGQLVRRSNETTN